MNQEIQPAESCVQCAFFYKRPIDKNSSVGQCRRLPPQVVRYRDKEDLVEEYSVPLVTESFWCGEFQPIEIEYFS